MGEGRIQGLYSSYHALFSGFDLMFDIQLVMSQNVTPVAMIARQNINSDFVNCLVLISSNPLTLLCLSNTLPVMMTM